MSYSFAQKYKVSKSPLQNAVIIATKLSDSTLIDFTRSNEQGFFEIKELPIDTYKVVISYKKFGDKIMYVIGTNKSFEFNFNKIIILHNLQFVNRKNLLH